MSLKHGLLGLLSFQEMSGYDVEKMFRETIGFFWHAKISQVYRELHTMEKAGWLGSREVVQTGKPNKKVYHITAEGHQEIENWVMNYKMSGDFEVRIGILMRIYFAANRPKEETIALLENFQRQGKEVLLQLAESEKDMAGLKENIQLVYAKATLDYGKRHYQMVIEWCEATIQQLKNFQGEKA